ncbi:lrr receptor-like serine threonine-protein kinase [Hordeum vulgare]|nr:lrr receptor-like serine threonine-protein kinase [Hordeum vulgare]
MVLTRDFAELIDDARKSDEMARIADKHIKAFKRDLEEFRKGKLRRPYTDSRAVQRQLHPRTRPLKTQKRMMVGGRKRKLADYDPYGGAFSDDYEYEYDSGDDVYKGNIASFTAKVVQKIKAKGVASFYNRKFKKWRCPYCTTKPKSKDGRFDHLLSHAEDVAIRGEDYKIKGQHDALAKALTPA